MTHLVLQNNIYYMAKMLLEGTFRPFFDLDFLYEGDRTPIQYFEIFITGI